MAVDDLPGPVVNLLNAIGVPWPYLNEDTVSQFATLTRQFAQTIENTHRDATQAVNKIAEWHQSASTERMRSGWMSMANQHVGELVTGCHVLADALDVAAGGWTGAGHVSASSAEAEAAYAAIRSTTGDVPRITGNTGISEEVIGQVKSHLFLTEHDVPIGPDQVAHGYFTADEDIASLWNKAERGTLTPAEHDQFRSLMAHEYVESRLMECGMPYRSADPEAWDENGTRMFSRDHFGAHDVHPCRPTDRCVCGPSWA